MTHQVVFHGTFGRRLLFQSATQNVFLVTETKGSSTYCFIAEGTGDNILVLQKEMKRNSLKSEMFRLKNISEGTS